jgi:hypothetical protein
MSCLSRRTILVNLVAMVALTRVGVRSSKAQDATPSGASLLARDVILPLDAVQELLPEMATETATGANTTAMGAPIANRGVTFATEDGEQRIVLSVDRYSSTEDATAAFEEAFRLSQEVPGVTTEAVDDLGEAALIGIVTQGEETHVGGGALFGVLIVNATMQAFEGTDANKEIVAELILKQAEHAAQVLEISATPMAG